MEYIWKGGLQGMVPSWDSVFSMRGLSVVCFAMLIGLLFANNTICKDVINNLDVEDKTGLTSEEIPEGVHPYEYEAGEEREPIEVVKVDISAPTDKV